ncbi:MAG: hypothetical protein LAT82_00355, partial [Nanoarchaeota archaeon]|nr:hypothetical protein [Nanoarchaeota archaeon]
NKAGDTMSGNLNVQADIISNRIRTNEYCDSTGDDCFSVNDFLVGDTPLFSREVEAGWPDALLCYDTDGSTIVLYFKGKYVPHPASSTWAWTWNEAVRRPTHPYSYVYESAMGTFASFRIDTGASTTPTAYSIGSGRDQQNYPGERLGDCSPDSIWNQGGSRDMQWYFDNDRALVLYNTQLMEEFNPTAPTYVPPPRGGK